MKEPQKKSIFKQLLGFIASIIIILIVTKLIVHFAANQYKKQRISQVPESVEKHPSEIALEAARKINARTPITVDPASKIVFASADINNRLVLRYRLTQTRSNQFTEAIFKDFAKDIHDYSCNSRSSEDHPSDIGIIYEFAGSDGLMIGKVTVDPPSCNQSSPYDFVYIGEKSPRTRIASEKSPSRSANVSRSERGHPKAKQQRIERCQARYRSVMDGVPDNSSLGEASRIHTEASKELQACVARS